MKLTFSALLVLTLSGCVGPPPTHALIVRHPEGKCALIAFSGCGALDEEALDEEPLDEDGGGVTPPE